MAKVEREYKIDLQEHLEKFAWKSYKEDHPIKSFFTRKNQYYVDIRWAFVDFQHEQVYFEPRKGSQGKSRGKEVELYESEYENKTDDDQTYTFETSRQTESKTSVQLEETYSIGGSTNLEVDIGGIVKFGGGMEGSLSVTNTDSQEFTDTATWNINTEISVASGSRVHAKLMVRENSTINDFEVKTTVKLPKDRLPICIRRISDNKVIDSRVLGKLSPVFEEDFLEKNKSSIKVETSVDENNKKWTFLVLTTRGVCKVMSFHTQNVLVTSEPIEGFTRRTPKRNKKGGKKGKAREITEDETEDVTDDGTADPNTPGTSGSDVT